MFQEELKNGLQQMNIQAESRQLALCQTFFDLLMEWNQRMNLTSIKEAADAVQKHFLDSLAPLALGLIPSGASIIDIGAGAGFPSLPLAIFREDCHFTLLDSVRKKTTFLEEACRQLGLNNVSPCWGRAEELARKEEYRETFTIAVNRAVAPINVLLEYAMPFLKVGGKMLSFKGPAAQEEIANAKKAFRVLGARLLGVHPAHVPGLDHLIVEIEKTAPTPSLYPRRAGTPTKSPI